MDVMICDDEPLARERLARFVREFGHEVIHLASNGKQALEQVRQQPPEIVLLDIRMPEMDGLSCAQVLSQLEAPPAIIFCTAFDQYAIEAFKTHAIAYLLKPVAAVDLKQALLKATRLNQAQLQALIRPEYTTIATQRQHITARTHRGIELIALEDIYYFLADQKYVLIRHKNGQVLIDETLKELEQEFGQDFMRIHRNALLSARYIDGLETLSNGQYQVRVKHLNERLMVSRRHLSQIKQRMQKL